MKNPLLLFLFILGIGLFILFYFVSALFYKKRHQNKYHFYQMFPYEFNYPNVFKPNFYGNIMFVLASLSVIAFYEVNHLNSLYRIVSIILSIVITMISILLLLLPLRYLKTHLALSVVLMTLSAALPLFNLFSALEQFKIAATDANKALCIASMIVSGLLSLTMLLLILNPRLSFKIYYDKKVDEEGKETLVRPKVIFIALNEWWAIFIYFLSSLAILLINLL